MINNFIGLNIKTLQVLRAIAAISVVYYHTSVNAVFGSFGVDIFFVLSGFVMAMIVNANTDPHMFIINRMVRVAPMYWLMTTLVLFLVVTMPELFNSTSGDGVSYIKSILFIPYYKTNGAMLPMLAVGWTLNYEVYFYLCVWGGLLFLGRFAMLFAIAVLSCNYLIFNFLIDAHVYSNFLGDSISFEFVFGVVSFFAYKHGFFCGVSRWFCLFVALLSYFFMAYCELFIDGCPRLAIYGVPSLFLVLAVVGMEATPAKNNKWSVLSLFVSIGNASYSIYLTHFFIVEGIKRIEYLKLDILNPYSPLGVLFTIVMCLAFGQVFYYYIDRPVSSYLKRKITSPSLTHPLS